jgi:Flp pilus assembly protein TadG
MRLLMIKRFRKNQDGATAVEFGFVAAPFFALLFAIIETALVFWSNSVLENAVADAARRVYTGQFQTDNKAITNSTDLANTFKTNVCSRVAALFDCTGKLKVDIATFTSFPAGVPNPINPVTKTFTMTSSNYQAVGPDQIVVVRAAFEHKVYTGFMNPSLSNLANGNRVIMASAVFKSEPFPAP